MHLLSIVLAIGIWTVARCCVVLKQNNDYSFYYSLSTVDLSVFEGVHVHTRLVGL